MSERASKEQVSARTAELSRILLDGAMNLDIEEYIREKEKEPESLWYVGPGQEPLGYSQVRRYISKAEKLIAAECKENRKKLLARHHAQRRRLYAAAVSQGDIRCALSVLQDEAELLGLYPAKKIAPSGADGGLPPLSVLVQTLIQAESGKVTISQTAAEPAKIPLAIFEGTTDETGNTTGIAAPLVGSEKMPG